MWSVPDGNGRVGQIDSHEDGVTYTDTYQYDDLDHRKLDSDLLGDRYTFVPRADGKNLSITDARGKTTTFEHSALGELLERTRTEHGIPLAAR